jgi:hypothetical protein
MTKQLLILIGAVLVIVATQPIHSQRLQTSSNNLYNVYPDILTVKPADHAVDNIFGTCPDKQPSGEFKFDAAGNGFYRRYDCAPRKTTHDIPYTNWLPDGRAFWPDSLNDFTVSAQYQHGLLVSITFLGCSGPMTLSFPNGTGDWKVPDRTDCATNPNASFETGHLKSGMKDGHWIAVNWGKKGPVYDVTYIDGQLDGICKWFQDGGKPWSVATYSHGVLNGPFVYYANDFGRVEGITTAGDATVLLNGLPGYFPKAGKASGTWRYYDSKGLLLGENVLGEGNGHFTNWSWDGKVSTEGNIKNGYRDGDWTQYDYTGTPTQICTYQQGQSTGCKPPPR